MSDSNKDHHSAEDFDPVAFAEWWLEHEWEKKQPTEFRRYLEGLKRREGKHE